MRHVGRTLGGVAFLSLFPGLAPAHAQQALPLEPLRPAGLEVSPIYEGWYRNPDGTLSLSFGYFNRNTEEVLEVAAGPANSLDGAGVPEQGLPTRFLPRRHYGVLVVTVPRDFGADQKIVWSLDVRGRKFAIPGRLNPLYEIDALGSPATGGKPPALRLVPNGPQVRGPRGVVVGPVRTRVGQPLTLTAWVEAEHSEIVELGAGENADTLRLHWYEWSGPAPVTFAEAKAVADMVTGEGKTTATFSEPGEYVLYVRTNESNNSETGHEQCCWSNGYVKVSVTP
jgi:hypothetical protein